MRYHDRKRESRSKSRSDSLYPGLGHLCHALSWCTISQRHCHRVWCAKRWAAPSHGRQESKRCRPNTDQEFRSVKHADPEMRTDCLELPLKLGEVPTANLKLLSEERESKLQHRYAVVVQHLFSYWIHSCPTKSKSAVDTMTSWQQFRPASARPRRIDPDNSQEFTCVCEDSSLNRDTSTPYRSYQGPRTSPCLPACIPTPKLRHGSSSSSASCSHIIASCFCTSPGGNIRRWNPVLLHSHLAECGTQNRQRTL